MLGVGNRTVPTVSFVQVSNREDYPVWPVEQSTAFHAYIEPDDSGRVMRFTGRGVRDYRPEWYGPMRVHRANRAIYRLLQQPIEHLHVPWAFQGYRVFLAPFALAIPNPGYPLEEPWWYHVTVGDLLVENAKVERMMSDLMAGWQPTLWDKLLDD